MALLSRACLFAGNSDLEAPKVVSSEEEAEAS